MEVIEINNYFFYVHLYNNLFWFIFYIQLNNETFNNLIYDLFKSYFSIVICVVNLYLQLNKYFIEYESMFCSYLFVIIRLNTIKLEYCKK